MNIVLTTGGTGGHIFPAIDVALELRKRGHDVSLIGPLKMGEQRLREHGLLFENLQVKGFVSKSFWAKIQALFLMIKAVGQSMGFLRKQDCDIVCGFGSYASVAVVIAAKFLRIPAMLHEQNVIPGQANRLLVKFVKKVAISFPEGAQYFPKDKTVLTGCPCRLPVEELTKPKALRAMDLKEKVFTILVMGGSQGSRMLNEIVMKAFFELQSRYKLQCIHLTGKADFQWIKKEYKNFSFSFAVFEFLETIENAYTAADLIIARAGAVTVSEIKAFNKPAIFIPYPHAQGHQKQNAQTSLSNGKTIIIDQNDLSVSKLIQSIDTLKNISTNAIPLAIKEDATQRLADEILTLS